MTAAPTFSARLIGIVLAVGVALAAVFAVLSAYAPDLADGQDGAAHALSNSAVGFSGIVRLARATGTPVTLSRDAGNVPAGGLLVLTPGPAVDGREIARLIDARDAQRGVAPVLLVLPKWQVEPVTSGRRGWVARRGLLPGPTLEQATAAVAPFMVLDGPAKPRCCITGGNNSRISFPVPARLRILEVPDTDKTKLEATFVDRNENAVVAWLPAKDVYILADPDLLNNHGIKDRATAAAALAMLRDLADGGPLTFDLTLNGFARSRNLARLAFEPPFLALTLCLIAAAALAGLQAAIRFGRPRGAVRAIPFGKRALVDNAAELIRSARREPAMAVRYARLMLDDAAASRGAPPGLKGPALGKWLDRRATASPPYAELEAAAAAATRREDGLAAARALHAWKEDVTHDR